MSGSAAVALLADLRRGGVEFRVQDDRLRFRPLSAVTPDSAARMACHKRELVELLLAEGALGESMWPDWDSAVDLTVVFNLDGRSSPPHIPCRCCSRREWWRLRALDNRGPGPGVCARCHPPEPPAGLIEIHEPGGGERG